MSGTRLLGLAPHSIAFSAMVAVMSLSMLAACGDDELPREDSGPRDSGVRDADPVRDTGGGGGADADGGVDVDDSGAPDEDGGDLPDLGSMDRTPPRDGGGGRLPLGQATIMSGSQCGGSVPTSQCLRMVITGCDGVADMGVRLKVTEPQGQVRGTIVFGVGGPGTGFYETFGAAASERVLVPLAMMGFRLVQRGWDAPGWLSGPGGPMKEACRSATMYDAIYKNIHTDGAYCATGQSAGSAEIAYALAHYGAEAIFDGVVPSAGPPLGRIDHGCLGLDDPAWINECDNLRTCPGGSCTYLGIAFDFLDGAYANNDCSTHRQGSRQTFLDDSVLNPLADLDYPQTAMRFVYGGADCSEAVPLGRVYADGVRSDKAIAVVPGVDHIIPASTAGADQIFADLVDVCIPRH